MDRDGYWLADNELLAESRVAEGLVVCEEREDIGREPVAGAEA